MNSSAGRVMHAVDGGAGDAMALGRLAETLALLGGPAGWHCDQVALEFCDGPHDRFSARATSGLRAFLPRFLRAFGVLFGVPRRLGVKEILYRPLGTHILSVFGLFLGHAISCVSEHRPPRVD